MIGYALTGSFCTHKKSIETLKSLISSGYEVIPILSETAATTNTRFGKAEELISIIQNITGHECIKTIIEAEKFGPAIPLESLIIAPCTGNTLAKMSLGITDTSVTMAAKAHLRCGRPLLICLASNDALSANLKNIASLLNKKSVYFVPMLQDDPINKPFSLVADFNELIPAFNKMMNGKQLKPIFK